MAELIDKVEIAIDSTQSTVPSAVLTYESI